MNLTELLIFSSARKLQSNVAIAIKGPPKALITVLRPENLVLAIITNDVEWKSKVNNRGSRLSLD